MRGRTYGGAAGTKVNVGWLGRMLVATAQTGLTTSTSALRRTFTARQFSALLDRAVEQRLSGHLAEARRCGIAELDDDQSARIAAAHTAAVMRVLELERTLIDVHAVLSGAAIDVRVLKGPALSRTVYEDPQRRTFVDVDVLVPSARFNDAVAALTAAGYRRRRPQLRAGFDERFAKTVTMVDAAGREVDLHRTLVVGPYGLMVHTDDLFDTARSIAVAGVEMAALGAEEQFLNICYHAVLGDRPPRLAVLHDVAVSLINDDLDACRVITVAQRWGGTAVLARAVCQAWDILAPDATPALVGWARAHQPGWRDRLLLWSYGGDGNGRMYLTSALVIRGVPARVAYLSGLLLPADGAHGGHVAWWWRGVRGMFSHRDGTSPRRVA